MLKRYRVIAVGREGVRLFLLQTFWMTRAVRTFHDAKDSGHWQSVIIEVENRPFMVYRHNPERRRDSDERRGAPPIRGVPVQPLKPGRPRSSTPG